MNNLSLDPPEINKTLGVTGQPTPQERLNFYERSAKELAALNGFPAIRNVGWENLQKTALIPGQVPLLPTPTSLKQLLEDFKRFPLGDHFHLPFLYDPGGRKIPINGREVDRYADPNTIREEYIKLTTEEKNQALKNVKFIIFDNFRNPTIGAGGGEPNNPWSCSGCGCASVKQ